MKKDLETVKKENFQKMCFKYCKKTLPDNLKICESSDIFTIDNSTDNLYFEIIAQDKTTKDYHWFIFVISQSEFNLFKNFDVKKGMKDLVINKKEVTSNRHTYYFLKYKQENERFLERL